MSDLTHDEMADKYAEHWLNVYNQNPKMRDDMIYDHEYANALALEEHALFNLLNSMGLLHEETV